MFYHVTRQCWDYCGKECDVIHELGEPPAESGSATAKRDAVFQEALAAETADQFLEIIKEKAAERYVIYHSQILEFTERYYSRTPEPYASPSFDFIGPEELRTWLSQARLGDDADVGRRKSLILYGPTRTGKTVWARSLGRHTYFHTMFNLREFDESAEYAVFDDLMGGFESFKMYKAWLGAQKEFTVTDKYARKRKVLWGKPTILLMNESPFSYAVDHEWLMGNCHIVEIAQSIIHFSCQ